MQIDFDRFDNLVKESGKSKSYLSRKVNKPVYYLKDAKKCNINIPDDILEVFASELNTTVDYLTGKSDIKEKPTLNEDELDLSGLSDVKREFISQIVSMNDDQVHALAALLDKFKSGS